MAKATAAEKNEFQYSKTSKKVLCSQSPLFDLPISINELILERLPLPDYIRFGSVCTKWYSIQKQHRILHSPSPPPMQKSFPWLIHYYPMDRRKSFHCYSPSDQKCFPFSIPEEKYMIKFSSLSHGWFFLVDKNHRKQISLFNPVSKSQIKFPPLMTNISTEVKGFLSASPLSSDCVALIMDDYDSTAFLYCFGQKQSKWTSLDIPIEFYHSNFYRSFYRSKDVVYCKGKFYCMARKFFVIDSVFGTPTINELNMDCSQFPSEVYDQDQTLVESNGEVLMVDSIYNYQGYKRFDVFKADFSKMIWVRLKSIDDRALFVAIEGSFCVLADDVGCKSNCVYLQDSSVVNRELWLVFDIGTMKWSNGPSSPYKEDDEKWFLSSKHWFLPSLDYNI